MDEGEEKVEDEDAVEEEEVEGAEEVGMGMKEEAPVIAWKACGLGAKKTQRPHIDYLVFDGWIDDVAQPTV